MFKCHPIAITMDTSIALVISQNHCRVSGSSNRYYLTNPYRNPKTNTAAKL